MREYQAQVTRWRMAMPWVTARSTAMLPAGLHQSLVMEMYPPRIEDVYEPVMLALLDPSVPRELREETLGKLAAAETLFRVSGLFPQGLTEDVLRPHANKLVTRFFWLENEFGYSMQMARQVLLAMAVLLSDDLAQATISDYAATEFDQALLTHEALATELRQLVDLATASHEIA